MFKIITRYMHTTSSNRILALKVLAMPSNLGVSGNIFGGWIMSQMDNAGGISAWRIANGRICTSSCEQIQFNKPIYVGDVINCYTDIIDINDSLIKVKVDVETQRINSDIVKTTNGIFTYIAVDKNGKRRNIVSSYKLHESYEEQPSLEDKQQRLWYKWWHYKSPQHQVIL